MGVLLDLLAQRVERCSGPRVLVAVDGPDAAGKTTLADALAERLGAARLCTDDLLQPPSVRYRRGELSPEGCYRDSVDLHRLRGLLDAAPGVLVVDGLFLLRPSLRGRWDLSVHLHVPPEETLRRALVRDAERLGGEQQVRLRYGRRYLPAQELYRAEADPWSVADVLVDNSDPAAPVLLRR